VMTKTKQKLTWLHQIRLTNKVYIFKHQNLFCLKRKNEKSDD